MNESLILSECKFNGWNLFMLWLKMSLKRAFSEGASSCRVGPAFVCANGLIKNALLGRVAMNTNEIAIASSNPTKGIKEFDLTLSNRKLKEIGAYDCWCLPKNTAVVYLGLFSVLFSKDKTWLVGLLICMQLGFERHWTLSCYKDLRKLISLNRKFANHKRVT